MFTVAPPALLLVVGASHVAMPLVSLARILGYRTAVLDARPRFATRERFSATDFPSGAGRTTSIVQFLRPSLKGTPGPTSAKKESNSRVTA
jgi:xanthine/CO dehydrogenase XdhC/CoxF family maturation factor